MKKFSERNVNNKFKHCLMFEYFINQDGIVFTGREFAIESPRLILCRWSCQDFENFCQGRLKQWHFYIGEVEEVKISPEQCIES